MDYWETFRSAFLDYAGYFWRLVTFSEPLWKNYLYWAIGASLAVYALELAFPWRKDQPRIRKDFWLDGFYVFFNFFLVFLLGFQAIIAVTSEGFADLLAAIGIEKLETVPLASWPVWARLLAYFVVRDFVQWNIHRLLHRVPWLWQFHKVHHSVEQMGFAAQMRFHPFEHVVYKSLEFIPLAMIGFGEIELFIVFLVPFVIGHLNHANIVLPLGPLRYVFNNPQMHIWHHSAKFPAHLPYGVNYGLSLSCWDYLFGTAWIPSSGRDIELGFDDLERFPKTFFGQLAWPLVKPASTQ